MKTLPNHWSHEYYWSTDNMISIYRYISDNSWDENLAKSYKYVKCTGIYNRHKVHFRKVPHLWMRNEEPGGDKIRF